jgi:iron complex outermembrane recepter protein
MSLRSSSRFAQASLAALAASAFLSTGAYAQAGQPGSPQAEDASDDTLIIVTAQKREESILDVPVSVNAVSSEQLNRQSIFSVSDLSRSVPSVSSSGAIRGLSTNGVTRSSAGAVAVLLDGVDLGPPSVGVPQISSLFDLERVEVLSGPQGTLFGTTASAGVINAVTKAPKFDKFEVIGRIDVEDFGAHREQLTLNAPLGENLALRVSGYNIETRGLVRNTITGLKTAGDNRGVRGRLRWEPSSNLEINLIADYSRGSSNGQRDIAYAIAPTPALQARLAVCGIVASLDNRENCSLGNGTVPSRLEKLGLSGQVDLGLGDHTLTSITAYRRTKLGDLDYRGPGGDSDFLSENILDTNLTAEDLKIFSQELRLTSPSDQPLEYQLGLFYFSKDQKDSVIQAGLLGLPSFILPLLGIPPLTAVGRINLLDIDQRAYAAFGQATFHATDKLSLIAGARYTRDKLSDVTAALTPLTTPTLASFGYAFSPSFFIAPVNESVKINNFSWKLGAQYQWTPNMMTYFTATRGYKGPAVNDQTSPPIAFPIIRPEIPMNYEVGLKGGFLDNRVLVTLALFHNKVKNFQTSVFVPPSATSPQGSFAQGNAPHIVSKGIDFNVTARPTDELTLVGGVLYNRASYSKDFLVACSAAQTTGVGGCSALRLTPPVSQLAAVPKFRFLLNGEYAKEVTAGLTIFGQADLTYESSQFSGTTPDPVLDISSKTLLNARIGVRDPDRSWGISAFAKNLLGTNFSRLTFDVLTGFNGGAGQSYWIVPARGATYGATIDFRF